MRAEAEEAEEPGIAAAEGPAPPADRRTEAVPEEGPPLEPSETREALPADTDVEWASKNLPLIGKLSSGAYYLQVGAYSSARGAKNAIDVLDQDYPVAVLPTESADRTVYRLFVGPLNEDERGTMLYWFRARGYKDAFIRKGE
jgi:cell division septation protein DedD